MMATTSARSAAGTANLSSALSHVVHERVPLARRDAQVPVGALHVLAGVFLRTSGGPAQHLYGAPITLVSQTLRSKDDIRLCPCPSPTKARAET